MCISKQKVRERGGEEGGIVQSSAVSMFSFCVEVLWEEVF